MKLNVISFNIRCCDDANGNSIAERAPRLAEVISHYDADIIALQEYTRPWEPHIDKYYGADYDMYLKYRNTTVDYEAAPILWKKDKFTLLKKGCFWLSDTPEIESRGWDEVYHCYRYAVYVILKDNASGEIFTAMNTHYGFGDAGQIKSSRLIYDYAKEISSFPTFITGDFNMRADMPGYAEMTKYFKDVNACTANDPSTTYHGYRPEEITDQHIDYCFIDNNVTPVHQSIIKDTPDGKFPSDHYGLYIELEV